ncbi:MAG: YgjV family protein [Parafilimonas terrae]|jgi:vacuolar-type H+-ATPase subunit I/STV1|nr:YgjV family protein [Parafilimonas terrae]
MLSPDVWAALARAAADHLDLFGLPGLAFGFATGLMPQRRLILLSSAACGLCFSVHFLRLGSPTGAAMNLIAVAQSLLAARFVTLHGRPPWLDAVFAGTFVLAVILTVATWTGLPSVFAGLAALVATTARLQASPQTMRLLLIGAALSWASHNILMGSVYGLTCDCLGLLGFTASYLRTRATTRPSLAALDALPSH